VKEILQYLQENFTQADEAAYHLNISVERCVKFIDNENFSEDELIELEALTGRFARLSDLFIQKILKTIDRLDGATPGTVRDRLLQAEKNGIISDANLFSEIRDIRNNIAHEYEFNALLDIFSLAYKYSGFIISAIQKAKEYSHKFYTT
jgi:uncharacterized protein YutE (UPF0331/DUF86 family)